MTQRYTSVVFKSALVALFACMVLLRVGGTAHAKLIKVTATGTISSIFNIIAPPFSIGDPFTYEVIVDDDPTLDTNPLPNYTSHSYSPSFSAGVAGSAKLTFGSYIIPESSVDSTSMSIANDSGFSDVIEISSTTTGAPSIDGIAPLSFSMKREDFTQTALSSAVVSEGLFVSGGFEDVDAVFLSVTGGGPCGSRKCVVGDITNVSATSVFKALPFVPLLLLGEETYWVDASYGSNTNPGTENSPFKTITHALGAAGENSTIRVNPGRYDEALGETFPLTLQSGQILIGDEANKGDGTTPTLIVGHGETGSGSYTATIIGSEDSRISGFKIGEDTSLYLHFAIWVDGISMKVSKNTLKENTYGGIRIMNNGSSVIEDNVFNTESYGVYVYGSSDAGTIQNNSFFGQALPVDVVYPGTYVLIRDNTITGTGACGIQVQHGHPLIENNTFNNTAGYTYGAIRAQFSQAEPTIRENVFICTKAVLITDGNPDLGTASEAGNNDFSSVTGASLTHEGSGTITAIGNTWPNSPPECGTDIVITGLGSVVWGTPALECP